MSTINCLTNRKPIECILVGRATMLTFKRLSLILSDETKCDLVGVRCNIILKIKNCFPFAYFHKITNVQNSSWN